MSGQVAAETASSHQDAGRKLRPRIKTETKGRKGQKHYVYRIGIKRVIVIHEEDEALGERGNINVEGREMRCITSRVRNRENVQ